MKNSTTIPKKIGTSFHSALSSLFPCISNTESSETRVGVGGLDFQTFFFIPQSGTSSFHYPYNYKQSEKERTHYIVSKFYEQTDSSLGAGVSPDISGFRFNNPK